MFQCNVSITLSLYTKICICISLAQTKSSCRFQKFQEEAEMWQEVQALTTSLRSDMAEPDADFLRDMFSQIPLGE